MFVHVRRVRHLNLRLCAFQLHRSRQQILCREHFFLLVQTRFLSKVDVSQSLSFFYGHIIFLCILKLFFDFVDFLLGFLFVAFPVFSLSSSLSSFMSSFLSVVVSFSLSLCCCFFICLCIYACRIFVIYTSILYLLILGISIKLL